MPARAASSSRQSVRRGIPSVGKVLQQTNGVRLPRPVIVAIIRRELAKLRQSGSPVPVLNEVVSNVRRALETFRASRIQPVINGTGIVIHTNLGRSPLASHVAGALVACGTNYTNIEYDCTSGRRGGRASYLEHNLALLCQAEATTVVNNCAAALVLALRHFTSGPRKEVIISRGELVQIGGGFRIPEILEASGAMLREVGTTNQTRIGDYQCAVGPGTAMILKVHRSNFYMDGFVEFPSTEEITALARSVKRPFVEDLGSGAILHTEDFTNAGHEPTPAESLRRGADLVCFSGDKLLGGPQAGLIAGKARHVNALKREPFFRALRCDKLILTALQTVVDDYLSMADAKLDPPPVIQMLAVTREQLQARAVRIVTGLADFKGVITIGNGNSQIGGGTLPKAEIPSVTIDVRPSHGSVDDLASRLRQGSTPIIGYITGGRFKIDLRTVFPTQDELIISEIRAAISH